MLIQAQQHNLDGQSFTFAIDPAIKVGDESRIFSGWADYKASNGITPKGGGPYLYDGRDMQLRLVVIDADDEAIQNFFKAYVEPTVLEAGEISSLAGLSGKVGSVPLRLLSERAESILRRFNSEDVLVNESFTLVNNHSAKRIVLRHEDHKEPIGEIYVELEGPETYMRGRLAQLKQAIEDADKAGAKDRAANGRTLAGRVLQTTEAMSALDSTRALYWVLGKLREDETRKAFLEAVGGRDISYLVRAQNCNIKAVYLIDRGSDELKQAKSLDSPAPTILFETLFQPRKIGFRVLTVPLGDKTGSGAKPSVAIADKGGKSSFALREVKPNEWYVSLEVDSTLLLVDPTEPPKAGKQSGRE